MYWLNSPNPKSLLRNFMEQYDTNQMLEFTSIKLMSILGQKIRPIRSNKCFIVPETQFSPNMVDNLDIITQSLQGRSISYFTTFDERGINQPIPEKKWIEKCIRLDQPFQIHASPNGEVTDLEISGTITDPYFQLLSFIKDTLSPKKQFIRELISDRTLKITTHSDSLIIFDDESKSVTVLFDPKEFFKLNDLWIQFVCPDPNKMTSLAMMAIDCAFVYNADDDLLSPI